MRSVGKVTRVMWLSAALRTSPRCSSQLASRSETTISGPAHTTTATPAAVQSLSVRGAAHVSPGANPTPALALTVGSVEEVSLLRRTLAGVPARELSVTVRRGRHNREDVAGPLAASLAELLPRLRTLERLTLREEADGSGASPVAWTASAVSDLAAALRLTECLRAVRLEHLVWEAAAESQKLVVAALGCCGGGTGLHEIGLPGMRALAQQLALKGDGSGALRSVTRLDLSQTHLGDLAVAALARQLASAGRWPVLRELRLAQCDLGDYACEQLREAAAAEADPGDSLALEVLDVSGNSLGDRAAFTLGGLLMRCHELRTLDLRQNRLTSAGAATVGSSLRHAAGLQCLRVRANRLQDAGLAALLASAPGWPALEHLDAARCRLTAACLPALAAALPSLESLEVLKLSGNDFRPLTAATDKGGDDVRLFAYDHDYMKRTSGKVPTSYELERRDRAEGRVRYTGTDEFRAADGGGAGQSAGEGPRDAFEALGAALASCRRLRVLELDDAALADDPVAALLSPLSLPRLEELRLCANPLFAKETTVAALAGVLRSAPGLRVLDLSFTALGDLGLSVLCDGDGAAEADEREGGGGGGGGGGVLLTLAQMEDLRLAHCGLRGLGLEALAETVRAMPSLRSLDLNANPAGADTQWVPELLESLARLPHFRCLTAAGVLRDAGAVRGTVPFQSLVSAGAQIIV